VKTCSLSRFLSLSQLSAPVANVNAMQCNMEAAQGYSHTHTRTVSTVCVCVCSACVT